MGFPPIAADPGVNRHMTEATLGIGTFLEYETVPGASPLAFTKVSEVLDLPELPHTREFVEATNQDSLNQTREYIAGLIDAEEFTVPCNYLPQNATHAAIWAMFNAGTARKWRVRESTTSPEITWEFDAIVASFNPAFPVGDKKALAVTLRRTGPTTRA